MLNFIASFTKNRLFILISALLSIFDFSEMLDRKNKKEFFKLIDEDFKNLKLFFRENFLYGKIKINYKNTLLFVETIKLTLFTFKSLENYNKFLKDVSLKKTLESEEYDDEDDEYNQKIDTALKELEAL